MRGKKPEQEIGKRVQEAHKLQRSLLGLGFCFCFPYVVAVIIILLLLAGNALPPQRCRIVDIAKSFCIESKYKAEK